MLFESFNNSTCLITSDFPFEISLYNVNLTTFKDTNFERRLNKTSNIVIYKRLIFISHINLLIYTKQIVKNRLFINYRFENVKFINIIRKKGKDNESSH